MSSSGFRERRRTIFALTLSLVREVGFVSLFAFKYSPRPLTPALRLGDDVPEAVKSERLARLFELVDAIGSRHLSTGFVGTRQRVLVEGASKNDNGAEPGTLVQGRTERNEIMHVQGPRAASLVGQVIEVEVVRAEQALPFWESPATLSPSYSVRRSPRRRSTGRRHGPRAALCPSPWAEMAIYDFKGVRPHLGRDVFVAENATVIGDVRMGDEASIWFGVVLRGDYFPIRVGHRTNIQDNTVLHITSGTGPTTLGDDVTVGHSATSYMAARSATGASSAWGASSSTESSLATTSVRGCRVPADPAHRGTPTQLRRGTARESRSPGE